jgi:tetratricopeptide (TPR) repeat protein
MNKHLLFLFCSLFALTIQSQKGGSYKNNDEQKLFESGKGLFEEHLYPLAYDHFKKVADKHPDDLYLKYLMGICNIFISDKHEEAMTLLTEVQQKNKKAADLDYYFAFLYHKMGEFDRSIEQSTKVMADAKLDPEKKKALKHLIDNCNNAKIIMNTIKDVVKIGNMGSPPNTDAAEYSPVITSDEETILFTYRGTLSKGGLRDVYDQPDEYGYYYEDIYMSRKVDDKWQKAEGLDDINTESNEAVLAISNDGQQLFIFKATALDGGDIYMSRLEGTKFTAPEKLRGGVNTTSWEGSISLSGDQNRVIFASERQGGYGGKDLYQATRLEDGSWGNVMNLGANINTEFDDDAPYIHPDGRTLIFSSRGHNSIGDFDIFLSDLDEKDSTWKKPVNAGYPINTLDDDIFYALSADGKKGYFASAKTGGFGDKDMYMIEPALGSRKSYLTIIKGKITENLLPYTGEIQVFISSQNRGYGSFKANSVSGKYLISLPAGKNYKLSYYHPIFGEKVAEVIADKANGYAERIVNINFGANDTTNKFQTLTIASSDTTKAVVTPVETKTITTPVETKTVEPLVANAGNEKEELKKMTRDQMLNKYGAVKVGGLKYVVQVGAYRHPDNYKGKKLQRLCSIKRNGIIMGDVNLIVANKEFETWLDADSFLKEIRNAGQPDAFLTAEYNNKRYYLKEIVEMGLWVKEKS